MNAATFENLRNIPVTVRITGRPHGCERPYLAERELISRDATERHKEERFGDYRWRANVLQSAP